MKVRRHKSARGRDDVIDLEEMLSRGLGFGCCFCRLVDIDGLLEDTHAYYTMWEGRHDMYTT